MQQLVESLYPKNNRLKEIRMGDIVQQLAIHHGSQVADMGCGAGEFSEFSLTSWGNPARSTAKTLSIRRMARLRLVKANLTKQHVKKRCRDSRQRG
jgi:cyclopropane fatty-acyl-phospholipid synthase-like methyltransferase